MKKIVLVLGLVMGSMIASDAIAAVSFNHNETAIVNNDKPKKEKKKKKKKHCKTEADATKAKGCSKEGSSCCKKKTTTETPAPAEK